MLWGCQGEMRLHLCPEQPPFGHDPIENRTLVSENHPFRARPQRAPYACTSGMKPHSYTYQNYANASTHYVIPSAAKNLHGTARTFAMKRLQVPCHFGGDRVRFCHEIAPGHPSLEGTACTFGAKLHQVSGGGQQSSARTALWPSRPERLTCSRRTPYIPATVPLVCITVPL